VPLCPDYQQHWLNSDQNTAGYSGSLQPSQNQAFAAQSQYYSSPGCRSQMVNGALQASYTQQHHSPMRQFQQPMPASAGGEHSSSWQPPLSSVDYTSEVGTGYARSHFCGFADQRHTLLGKNRQHFDESVKLKQQYSGGFGTPSSMQHGFAGGQQMLSSVGVLQNHHVSPDGEANVMAMIQSVSAGGNRQQMTFERQDMVAGHQQTAGFAGQRPRHLVAAPRHHPVGMNPQCTTIADAFTSYQNPGVMQPSHSFTVQQPMSWNEPRSCPSYAQTGCFLVLITSIWR